MYTSLSDTHASTLAGLYIVAKILNTLDVLQLLNCSQTNRTAFGGSLLNNKNGSFLD